VSAVSIVVATDLHGQLLPFDYVHGKAFPGGLTKVSTFLKKQREKNPTLFFDNGDAFQGSPLTFYAHKFFGNKVNPVVEAYNELELNGMAVGNHEFNYGLRYLKEIENQSRFPLLSANIEDETTNQTRWLPFKVYRFGNKSIGVIALTTPAIEDFDLPWKWKGLRFDDPITVAKRLVAQLKDQQVDTIVVLAHSGIEYDPIKRRKVSESSKENFVYALATKVPGIDVIVFGHTHRAFGPIKVGKTIILQPASYGRGVALIEINDGRITNVQNVDLYGVEDDPAILDMFWGEHRKTNDWINEVIGIASEDFVSDTWKISSEPVSNLYLDVLRYATENEITMHPPSPFEPAVIRKGWLTRKDAFNLYPFENEPVVLKISGATLKKALEWNARYYYLLSISPKWVKPVKHPFVKPYNFETIGGVEVIYDLTEPEGCRVRKAKYMGAEIHQRQNYWVSLTSYRASGAGGFGMLKNQPIEFYSPTLLRHYFEQYLAEKGTISPRKEKNWWFVANSFTLS
jgi:2',3'-cyclic-nucleotide 2'-phosphodiesterase/3'-nucleotidase